MVKTNLNTSYYTVKKIIKGDSERVGIVLPVIEGGCISKNSFYLLLFDGTRYMLSTNNIELGITRIMDKRLREAIDDVILYYKKVFYYRSDKNKASVGVVNTYDIALNKSIEKMKSVNSAICKKDVKCKNVLDIPLFNRRVLQNLYHAGTMDISRKRSFSLEGDGLSVSICPNEWRRITRQTESGLWLLQKKDVKMLDYYKLTKRSKAKIVKWGIEQGLAIKSVVYDVESYIDDAVCYSTYATYEEAIEETDIPFLDKEEDKEEYEEQLNRIIKREGLKATSKLKSIVKVDIDASDVETHLVLLYCEYVLKIDGVYWDDVLDVLNYSAPRGVIFNSRLSSFNKTRLE